jgi:hypothetical protein
MMTLLLWARYLLLALVAGLAASLIWMQRSDDRTR